MLKYIEFDWLIDLGLKVLPTGIVIRQEIVYRSPGSKQRSTDHYKITRRVALPLSHGITWISLPPIHGK